MIGMIKKLSDRALGRGDYSVSVPPMDGAFQTNSFIEEGKSLAMVPDADNIVLCNNKLIFSVGATLFNLTGSDVKKIGKPFSAPILAMAAHGERIALALADGRMFIGKPNALSQIALVNDFQVPNITGLDFYDDETLVLCIGSEQNSPECWTKDLLDQRNSGSLWSIAIGSGTTKRLASNLAYPSGVLTKGDSVIVCEAWRHRIIEVSRDGTISTVLAYLPGYPGRLANDCDGGTILSVFAPRSQLIELVLRKSKYRKRMMEEVPPHLWIAPALSSGKSYLEPMQGGAVKQMGVLKPWAPTRSYGLVVRLDGKHQPIESFHSRADGKRHGITSALRHGNNIVMTSRGNGEIVAVSSPEQGSQT